MSVSIATITIKSAEPDRLAAFWRDLLSYEQIDHPTDSIRLDDPDGRGPTLLVQPTEDRSAAGVIHLDLRPDDQQTAVAHALELGATRLEIGQTGLESWEVLADPEGNEFCILQSTTELRTRGL